MTPTSPAARSSYHLTYLAGIHGAGAPGGRLVVAGAHAFAGFRLVAAVVDLGDDAPALAVDGGGDLGETGDVRVVAGARHAGVGFAFAVDVEVTLDDQTDLPSGELLVAPDHLGPYDAARDGVFAYRIAQGVEMGRPSVLEARTEKSEGEVVNVWIGGESVMVSEGLIEV